MSGLIAIIIVKTKMINIFSALWSKSAEGGNTPCHLPDAYVFWAAKLKRNLGLSLREIKSFEQTHTCDWLTKPRIVLSIMYDTYTTFTDKRLDESKEGRS